MTKTNKICTDVHGATYDGKTLRAIPPPRLNLTTVDDIRRELGKVYRDARSGVLQTQEATRLGYLLDLLRKMIETGEFERRLEQLEKDQAR